MFIQGAFGVICFFVVEAIVCHRVEKCGVEALFVSGVVHQAAPVLFHQLSHTGHGQEKAIVFRTVSGGKLLF